MGPLPDLINPIPHQETYEWRYQRQSSPKAVKVNRAGEIPIEPEKGPKAIDRSLLTPWGTLSEAACFRLLENQELAFLGEQPGRSMRNELKRALM